MKVYCDRLATVVVSPIDKTFQCPKCKGVCMWSDKRKCWDCLLCARGWEEVPDTITTESEALKYLSNYGS